MKNLSIALTLLVFCSSTAHAYVRFCVSEGQPMRFSSDGTCNGQGSPRTVMTTSDAEELGHNLNKSYSNEIISAEKRIREEMIIKVSQAYKNMLTDMLKDQEMRDLIKNKINEIESR